MNIDVERNQRQVAILHSDDVKARSAEAIRQSFAKKPASELSERSKKAWANSTAAQRSARIAKLHRGRDMIPMEDRVELAANMRAAKKRRKDA